MAGDQSQPGRLDRPCVYVDGGAIAGGEGGRASPNIGISRNQDWDPEGSRPVCPVKGLRARYLCPEVTTATAEMLRSASRL